MSEVRVSVEWIFADIIDYFKFLDFQKIVKISLNAVGKMNVTCALLDNARVCCYGSTTLMFLPQKLGIIFTKSAKHVLQKLNNTFPLEK